MKLPEGFIAQMKAQLNEEWDEFLRTYDQAPIKGIRVNTLKISVEEFIKICPFEITPVPWTRNGFYVDSKVQVSKEPYYLAGLYYIQEPSAMLPAELLEPLPGETVLDLCAAPGGKTMQLADMMKDQGLLVANDLNNHRLKALIRNAELMGVKNLVVLNEHQNNIGPKLKGCFDKLLIDAPCSGEGMFKKHSEATQAYASYDIKACTTMQTEILDEIVPVLKNKGKLVYSTCTFNESENEDMLKYAMTIHPLELIPQPLNYGFEPSIALDGAIRLYPHKVRGEGHFVGVCRYNGGGEIEGEKAFENKPPQALDEFMTLYLTLPLKGHFKVSNQHVFLLPERTLNFQGLKMVKAGWYLGKLNKDRFEPSHAFALGLKERDFKQTISFKRDSQEIMKYLKCETVHCHGQKGYNLICVDGYPVGWGKWANNKLKNLYPAPWRL